MFFKENTGLACILKQYKNPRWQIKKPKTIVSTNKTKQGVQITYKFVYIIYQFCCKIQTKKQFG